MLLVRRFPPRFGNDIWLLMIVLQPVPAGFALWRRVSSKAVLPFNFLRLIISLKCLRVITFKYKQLAGNKTEATLSSLSTLSREHFGAEANRCAQQLVHCSSSDTLSLEDWNIYLLAFFTKSTHCEKCGWTFAVSWNCGLERVPCKACEIKYLTNEDKLNTFSWCWLSRWTKGKNQTGNCSVCLLFHGARLRPAPCLHRNLKN